MKKLFYFLLLLSVTIFMFPRSVQATNTAVPFSVSPILPENQVSSVSYFDIEMDLGSKQTLEVIISNNSDEPIEILVQANTGYTNRNGVIVYDGSVATADNPTNAPLFNDLNEVEVEKIKIPAQSEETAVINVTAPNESFDGIILGGLYFLMEAAEDEDGAGVSIQNQYAYVIGVNIKEKGNNTEVSPKIELVTIQAADVIGVPGIQLTLNNLAPAIASNTDTRARIYATDDPDTFLGEKELSTFSIAPSLSFNYPIAFNEDSFEDGEYIVELQIENHEYAWDFKETFTIEDGKVLFPQ